MRGGVIGDSPFGCYLGRGRVESFGLVLLVSTEQGDYEEGYYFFKISQHAFPPPSFVTDIFRPLIIIPSAPAIKLHTIDSGTSSYNMRNDNGGGSIVELFVGEGGDIPLEFCGLGKIPTGYIAGD